MAKSFYSDKVHWWMYAVISRQDMIAYVAKSSAKDPKPRFYEHLRGENKWTAEDFGPNGYSDDTELIILESVFCTSAEAYKHLIAWGHYFEEHSFALINNPNYCNACDIFHPETQKIYDTVCAPFPVDVVLNRNVERTVEYTPPPKVPQKPKKPEAKKTQLNIRVSDETANSFRAFCDRNKLSQSDALDLLLAPDNMEELGDYNGPWDDLTYYKNLVEIKEAELQNLRSKHGEIRTKESIRRKVLTELAKEVFLQLEKRGEGRSEVPHITISPKRFRRAKQFYKYHYPTEAGCLQIKLVDLVNSQVKTTTWGKMLPSPLFVLAETTDGKEIKFRSYRLNDFIGLFFDKSDHSYVGSEWLVAYDIAADGAADLIAAIPMDLLGPDGETAQEYIDPPQPEETEWKESLDEKLKQINNRL